MHNTTAITNLLRYTISTGVKSFMLSSGANTYVTIGRPKVWGDDNTETATEISHVVLSTNYLNQIYRDMIAVKKVQQADVSAVIPRVDWVSGTAYSEYSDYLDLFNHYLLTGQGTANTTSGSVVVSESSADFSANISIGDIIEIGEQRRQVVSINAAANTLNVNTSFTSSYNSNTLYIVENKYPRFANSFYVRNSRDEVFKCLHNNNNSNSTVEPTIGINGQLPESSYIETSDGYKWKYMYTIPYGLKSKFFTSDWMPVVTDTLVSAAAVGGRIDIIDIIDGGSEYYSDGQSGTISSLDILTVTGDGTGADITAKVQSGVITDLNILSGGSGYTNAVISISDPDQSANGNSANLRVIIGPQDGHGFNSARELGCYAIMISVSLEGTEGGKIEVKSPETSQDMDYRQICVLRNPLESDGSTYASNSVYNTTKKLSVTEPGVVDFIHDETISSANFYATVVYWDATNNELHINNEYGPIQTATQIIGSQSGAVATVISVIEPELQKFTGDLLYVNNRSKVIRDSDQTEQIRIVLAF